MINRVCPRRTSSRVGTRKDGASGGSYTHQYLPRMTGPGSGRMTKLSFSAGTPRSLRRGWFDEFAVDVGEPEVASLEAEGEPLVIDT